MSSEAALLTMNLAFRRMLPCALVVAQFVLALPGLTIFGQQPAPTGPMSRPCNPEAGALKPKKKPKPKDQVKPLSGTACLDVRESPLSVQESLQKFVREQRWNIGEEQLTEDTWTFSRYLKKEELGEYAQPWRGPAIEWRAGKVQINVRTTELPDGYAQTIVTAHYEGFGDLQDQFATKRESWILQSNGTLESAMIAVLQKQLENSH
jgi:hypothetical protein